MSVYALEIYRSLTNEAAITTIARAPLSPRLRLLMIDRARNLASWTAPHAGVLGRARDRDDAAAKEELREEQRRLERALDETMEVVRIESEGESGRG